MLQELLERSNVSIVGTKTSKLSTPNGLTPNATPSPSHAPSSSTPTDNNLIRCPRCDSSNTKFCYYNNYNLTQPRHFCRACRRYWTKGGSLRNVPIGGGCRKNKHSTLNTTKFKTCQSPNLLSNSGLHARALVSDSLGLLQLPSNGLSSSFYINQGTEVENNGLEELYQRLRSSTASCYGEHAPVLLANMGYASTTSTTTCYSSSGIFESAPVSSGLWSPSTWPADNLPTAYGAHPSQL